MPRYHHAPRPVTRPGVLWVLVRGAGTRDKVILATKVVGPGPHVTHVRDGNRLNRAHITAAVEGSLRRLQTDRIDLYQLHWPDRPVPLFGTRVFTTKTADAVPIEALGIL